MKRIWFAILFIILCAGLCAYEQVYIKTTSTELISMLEQAQEYDKKDNSEKRDEKIKEIQKYWEEKNDFLFTFSEHETLDELALNIRSLKEAHNTKSALAETKALVIIFYEDQKISPANIF